MIIEGEKHLLQVLERVPVGHSIDGRTGPVYNLPTRIHRARRDAWSVEVGQYHPVYLVKDRPNMETLCKSFLPLRLASYETKYWAEYDPELDAQDEPQDVFILQSPNAHTSLLVGAVGDPVWDTIWALANQYQAVLPPRQLKDKLNGFQLSSPVPTQLVSARDQANGELIQCTFHEDTSVTLLVVSSHEVWFQVRGNTYGPLTRERYNAETS